jgi:adenosine kinase
MDIVLTGSVAYDYLMKFPGYFRDHILPDRLESISLSFLVESMVRRRGGIAPNIAYTLALLGEKPRVMATVGEDCLDYKAWLSSFGVQTEWMKVVPGEFTASFFANTDRSNAQIASFYPGAMAYASQLSFYDYQKEGGRPDLVVISPNDPGAMNKYVQECRELEIPYLFDPSQQTVRLTAEEIRTGIAGARAMFVNDYEFNLIKKTTGMSEGEIRGSLELFVITCGEEGSIVSAAGERYEVPAAPTQVVSDPTGVGDAYRGGFLAGMSHGFDWETCGKMGSLAATYCLEQEGPQGQHYTPAEFTARFRRYFDDEGLLDGLLSTGLNRP